MPGRYEMVEEPSLEGTFDEDSVYHPDQSLPPDTSIRSLEPIIAGPIGLKTVFYDPRWSERQRKGCIALLACSALSCFIILVLLFVGLAKVLTHITWMEEMKKHGLHMEPDLEAMDLSAFFYSKESHHWGNAFANGINQTIFQEYGGESQPSSVYEPCGEGVSGPTDERKLCRFPFEDLLRGECTSENNYGYRSGKPCILLQFKHEQGWQPQDSNGKTLDFLNVSCDGMLGGTRRQELSLQFYPDNRGFDVRFFRPKTVTVDGQDYDLKKPAVMVQFNNLDEEANKGMTLEIQCRIGDAKRPLKPANFYGVKILDFDVRSIDDPFPS